MGEPVEEDSGLIFSFMFLKNVNKNENLNPIDSSHFIFQ